MTASNYFDELPGPEAGTEGRRGRKKRATAHRIFRSAITLMRAEGFHSVTIEQICDHADVARATFFQHFANKAALLGFFSSVVCQRIEIELQLRVYNPAEQLALIADHLQLLTDELGPIAPDMLSAFIADPGSHFHIDKPKTGISALVVQSIHKGQEEGIFDRSWHPNDVAICLVSAWVGLGRQRVANPKAEESPAYHAVLDLISRGVMAQKT